MTFNHLNRRTHLYLALLLLPWFFMYGVSSLPFSHSQYFQEKFGKPEWKTRFERTYEIEIPPESDLRQVGAQILKDNDLEGSFGVYQPNPERLNIYILGFISPTQVNYFPLEKRLVVADRTFNWNVFLTGMHARGGFQQESFLSDAWAVIVDIVCISMLIWIGSGIYMWWRLSQTRFWGFAALGGGVLSFGVFLWGL